MAALCFIKKNSHLKNLCVTITHVSYLTIKVILKMPVVTDQIFHFCRYKVYKRAWQHIKCFSHNKKQEILVYFVVIITQNPDITPSFLENECTHTDYAETNCRTREEQHEVKCHVFFYFVCLLWHYLKELSLIMIIVSPISSYFYVLTCLRRL